MELKGEVAVTSCTVAVTRTSCISRLNRLNDILSVEKDLDEKAIMAPCHIPLVTVTHGRVNGSHSGQGSQNENNDQRWRQRRSHRVNKTLLRRVHWDNLQDVEIYRQC
jgi:hypothetical protein|mmetsp:Transcript_8075/g.12239  ORF Transcript_8075/g.12239 Transcript_8075/m.12239 type:complete len:108 (+) Transcript_8075:96-419(+)